METALPLLVLPGLLLGGLVVQHVIRWLALLQAVTARQGGDFLGPPRRRLLWAVPFALLLHPAPYAIGALLVITRLGLLDRLSSAWDWLLAGLYAHLMLSGVLILSRYRQLRRKLPKL